VTFLLWTAILTFAIYRAERLSTILFLGAAIALNLAAAFRAAV
jgi:hypothetical protein